ncbi:MAG TPA: hypothetical protein VF950_17885 [Planctomycetota bacterium]
MKRLTGALLCGSLLGGCVMYEDRYHTPGVTPVQKADVLSMRAANYPDGQILDMIHKNGVARRLTADEVVEMNNAGVSGPVMNAMLEAPVTRYRPATEVRHAYYDVEPAVNFGAAVLTGYLIGRHFRH